MGGDPASLPPSSLPGPATRAVAAASVRVGSVVQVRAGAWTARGVAAMWIIVGGMTGESGWVETRGVAAEMKAGRMDDHQKLKRAGMSQTEHKRADASRAREGGDQDSATQWSE